MSQVPDEYLEVLERIRPHFDRGVFAGFYIPQGWLLLVSQLNDRLEKRDPCYLLGQAKEKFGGLRYYLEVDWSRPEGLSDDEYESLMDSRWQVLEEMREIVTEYEVRSLSTCQTCGDINARPRDWGWVATLCDRCFEPLSQRTSQAVD